MTPDDARLAADVAAAAGARLLELRANASAHEDLRTCGDRIANELILARLRDARPDDSVLSEESVDDLRRLRAFRVWIVDPLDGTREFGECGRTDWAVHVALWERGSLVAGAVALPARDLVLATDPAPVVPPAPERRLRMAVSRTRPPPVAAPVAADLGAELVTMGSAGAKAMAVVLGDIDVYLHEGGQHEWDSAAPVAVAVAAGLHASRLDGAPLAYNRPEPWLPDLLICRPELAAGVIDAATAVGNN